METPRIFIIIAKLSIRKLADLHQCYNNTEFQHGLSSILSIEPLGFSHFIDTTGNAAVIKFLDKVN